MQFNVLHNLWLISFERELVWVHKLEIALSATGLNALAILNTFVGVRVLFYEVEL